MSFEQRAYNNIQVRVVGRNKEREKKQRFEFNVCLHN